MLSIQNTIIAAQELADYFDWAVFPVNPKTKTPTSVAGKKLQAQTRIKLKMFSLVFNMLRLGCVRLKFLA
jgi:hypothetical protein